MNFLFLFVSFCLGQSLVPTPTTTKIIEKEDAPNPTPTLDAPVAPDSTENDSPPQDECFNCLIGNFIWVSPPSYKVYTPFTVGEPVVLQWKYSEVVKILPRAISIQIKDRDNNWKDIVTELSGFATEYEWTPKDLSTYEAYRLAVFESDTGREGRVKGGHANAALSNELGVRNPNDGGSNRFYSSAEMCTFSLFFVLMSLVL